MKINLLKSLFAAVVCALAGCMTIETASTDDFATSTSDVMPGRPTEHVVVGNYGWYLFNQFPLIAGDPDEDAILPFTFFKDTVKASIVHDKLTRRASARGADVADIGFHFYESVMLSIPGLSIPVPLPYVICYREKQVSAVYYIPDSVPESKDGGDANEY